MTWFAGTLASVLLVVVVASASMAGSPAASPKKVSFTITFSGRAGKNRVDRGRRCRPWPDPAIEVLDEGRERLIP